MGKGVRSLSKKFLGLLTADEGIQRLVDIVKEDYDLCFEPRQDHATLYYRGTVIVEFYPRRNGSFECIFRGKTFKVAEEVILSTELSDKLDGFKRITDDYLSEHNDKVEKTYQFRIAHENSSISSDNDEYIFVDSEYKQFRADSWQIDLVALNMNSTIPQVSLIEVKQGNETLRTSNDNPGIRKHLEDFRNVFDERDRILGIMKEDFGKVLHQKKDLGLIESLPEQIDFDSDKIEFLFVIVNYDFNDKKNYLREELKEIRENEGLYQVCKDNTFFYFFTDDGSKEDYKLRKEKYMSFETVMQKYSK